MILTAGMMVRIAWLAVLASTIGWQGREALAAAGTAIFADEAACAGCHAAGVKAWQG